MTRHHGQPRRSCQCWCWWRPMTNSSPPNPSRHNPGALFKIKNDILCCSTTERFSHFNVQPRPTHGHFSKQKHPSTTFMRKRPENSPLLVLFGGRFFQANSARCGSPEAQNQPPNDCTRAPRFGPRHAPRKTIDVSSQIDAHATDEQEPHAMHPRERGVYPSEIATHAPKS